MRPVSLYSLRVIIAVSETRLNKDSKSVIEMGVAGRLADQRSKRTDSISWHLPATPRSVVKPYSSIADRPGLVGPMAQEFEEL